MNAPKEDRAQVVAIPPLYFIAGLALGLLLNQAWPLPRIPQVVAVPAGVLCIALSLALVIGAVRVMRKARTAIDVRNPTMCIVTIGPYRRSRNPMYLSLLLLVAGICLILNALWVIVLLPAIVVVVNRLVILPEERYLEAKFGDTYLAYKRSARRWL